MQKSQLLSALALLFWRDHPTSVALESPFQPSQVRIYFEIKETRWSLAFFIDLGSAAVLYLLAPCGYFPLVSLPPLPDAR